MAGIGITCADCGEDIGIASEGIGDKLAVIKDSIYCEDCGLIHTTDEDEEEAEPEDHSGEDEEEETK